MSTVLEKTFLLDKMPNNENIIFDGIEKEFVKSFSNGEEDKYVDKTLSNLPLMNKNIIDIFNSLNNIENYIIFANYNFNYKMHNKLNFRYQYSEEFKCIDKDNKQYVVYKDILIPVYYLHGLSDKFFCIVNINKMGKFCRDKYEDFFDINIIEYSRNNKHLENAMKNEIVGCDLKGEKRKKYLLESVNIIIREYIKFENKEVEGYKVYYNKT